MARPRSSTSAAASVTQSAKGRCCAGAAAPTDALFAAEHITPRIPDSGELQVADRALAALPFAAPLYARVDLIRSEDARPCLLELELTEPSLFFAHAPDAARRFAELCRAASEKKKKKKKTSHDSHMGLQGATSSLGR